MKTYYERIEYNMATKVTITNTLTKVIGAGEGRPTFISPSGVTVPCTPIQEYISDMVTIDDGTLYIPAYNKVQMLKVPYGAKIEFDIPDGLADTAKEVNYWENIHVEGAKIEVANGNTSLVEEYSYTLTASEPSDWGKGTFATKEGDTYTDVTFTGEGTEASPYVPAWEADTYYRKTENVLPTNNVD
jgi:hypothetical protein